MKIKVNIKSAFLLLFMVAMSSFALAQRTIKGIVKDADNGEPLIGASVLVTGTTTGTATDVDGSYTLEIPTNATSLTVSFAGYNSQQVAIGASNVVDVALKGGQMLDQVVVVGYGSLKTKEVSSAVTSLKEGDFNKGNISDPVQLLQGKVAGLTIARPGGDPNGNFALRLRGVSTLGGNAEPLVVVDGVVGVSLNNVDPNDIASIDVLKDGSAAAIYGTRGSSGVILITTKKGASGKTTVEYNGQITTESLERHVPITDAAGYRALGGTDLGNSVDWFDQISQSASSQIHNLSLGGGINKTTYRVAMNYRDMRGVLKNSGFNQLNGRLNLTQKALSDKLTLSADLALTNRNADYSFPEAFRYAAIYNPTAPIYDVANKANAGYGELGGFEKFNPVAMIEQNINQGTLRQMVASFKADYQFMKGLNASFQYAQDNRDNKYTQYYSKFARFRGQDRNGIAIIDNQRNTNSQYTTLINYSNTFGKINVSALGGHEYQKLKYENARIEAAGFLTDNFQYNNIGTATEVKAGRSLPSSGANLKELESFFGRVSASYDGIYTLTASVRRDGASLFGDGQKTAVFPAVSIGVDLQKVLNIKQLDALKLRAGYGVTGALPRDPYTSLELLTVSDRNAILDGTNYIPTVTPKQNPNKNLKWEVKKETNIGVDFAALGYRLTGSIDYYVRNINDLLYRYNTSAIDFYAPDILYNIGDMQSNGFEVLLNYNAIKTKSFDWTTSINFATNVSKFLSLSKGDFKFGSNGELFIANAGAPGLNNTTMIRVKENDLLGQIYGPRYTGAKADGTALFADLDGDGVIEPEGDDREVLGNGLPKITLGWNNTFKYNNFDFNFFFRGVFGHSLINTYRIFYENANAGQIAGFNRIKTTNWDPNLKDAKFGSHVVEKADFLRLDNFTLGYTLPLPQGGVFTNARFFLAGNNLFTITKYTGIDPEPRYGDVYDSDNGGYAGAFDPLAPGIERRSTYNRVRSFSLGVQLGF